MSNFNESHPEKKEDEIFVTNLKIGDEKSCYFETKRVGNVAYTKNGEKINSLYKPLFVRKSEYERLKND